MSWGLARGRGTCSQSISEALTGFEHSWDWCNTEPEAVSCSSEGWGATMGQFVLFPKSFSSAEYSGERVVESQVVRAGDPMLRQEQGAGIQAADLKQKEGL